MSRICPECGGRVDKTIRANIVGHLNKTRIRPCPGSFQPYEKALTSKRRTCAL